LSRLVGLLADGRGTASVRSQAAYRAGFIASDLGDDAQTLALAQQALTEAQAGADGIGEIRARRVISSCLFGHRGDVAMARQHIETAIRLATEQDDDLLTAKCMLVLAEIVFVTGSLHDASERVQQILDGPAGTLPSIAMNAHAQLGDILRLRGCYADSRRETTKALALAESINSLSTVIGAHLDLADTESALGRFDDAAAHIAVAEELNPDTAHTWDAVFLIARADLALARGDDVEALRFVEQAAALEDESYSAGFQGVANVRYLGDAQLSVGNTNAALTAYRQLIAKATAAQDACRLAEGHEGYAATACALGNTDDAHQHLTAAREIRDRTHSQRLPRPAVDRLIATLEAEHTARVTSPPPPPADDDWRYMPNEGTDAQARSTSPT
jgi:tetratricopeptide (TPR) repeat protein